MRKQSMRGTVQVRLDSDGNSRLMLRWLSTEQIPIESRSLLPKAKAVLPWPLANREFFRQLEFDSLSFILTNFDNGCFTDVKKLPMSGASINNQWKHQQMNMLRHVNKGDDSLIDDAGMHSLSLRVILLLVRPNGGGL